MVSITIESKAGSLMALMKVIDGNITREIWIPVFLVDQITSLTKAEIKTLKDTILNINLGEIDV